VLPTGRRFGENTVLEGSIDPREVAAAVLRLRRVDGDDLEPLSWTSRRRQNRAAM
jgi:hypothetical protein